VFGEPWDKIVEEEVVVEEEEEEAPFKGLLSKCFSMLSDNESP